MEKDSSSFVHPLEILAPPLHQRGMGCCSAVAVAQCLAAMVQLIPGGRNDLRRHPSVQELVDKVQEVFPERCSKVPGEGGFRSFAPEIALDYINLHGVSLEAFQSYCGRRTSRPTPPCCTRLWIQKYHTVARDVNIRPIIHQHPIVGVFKTNRSVHRYREGTVYQGAEHDDEKIAGRHAVVIFGYGNEKGREFYWIQNSWGAQWGKNGIGKVSSQLFVKFVYPDLEGISISIPGLRRMEAANVELEKMNGSLVSKKKHWCQELVKWGKAMMNGCRSPRTRASIYLSENQRITDE